MGDLMNKPLRLSGAGGGGGGGSSPNITPDTLLSKDIVEFILGVCEGPIAGLHGGPQGFFLDGTPLVSKSGDNNFNPFELHVYHGDENASAIRNILGGTTSNFQVGVKLAQDTPVVRTTPASLRNEIDRLEVRLTFNTLVRSNNSGDQLEETARFTIKYRAAGEPSWRNFFDDREQVVAELSATRVTNASYDKGGVTSTTRLVDIPVAGNLTAVDPFGKNNFTVTGWVNDSSEPGFDKSKSSAYGTLYFNSATDDYKFVVDQGAAAGITDAETVSFNITAPAAPGETYTATIEFEIRSPSVIELKGKTTSGYTKDFVKGVPRQAQDWEIQVEKLSPDNEEFRTIVMTWESFQAVTQEARSYDNLAVARGLGQASDQFSGIPNFSGVYGCKIVRVPSNYDPITRHYDGAWDGTWKLAHTDNPAWCLYDLLTNELYGLKYYYPQLNVDRYSFYDAAKWCDELVPRPGGGYQPRYTYNDKIDQPRNAIELVYHIAGIFGGVPISDLNGTVGLKLDKPGLPVQIFGPESITPEGFQYSFSDVTQRPNDITVKFLNPNLDFEEDVRQVYNQTLIDENGRIPDEMVALGCNDVFEAQRRAFRRLLQANTEITTVTFQTARMGLGLEIFDLIGIVDPHMNWGVSGRVKAFDPTASNIFEPYEWDTLGSDISSVTNHEEGYVSLTALAGPLTINTSNKTSGLSYRIDHSNLQYSGELVRVWVKARRSVSNGSDQFTVTYAGHDNGNAGPQVFTLQEDWRWFSFDWLRPVVTVDDADYVGIWPDAAKTMDIQEVRVETLAGKIQLRDPLYLPTGTDLDLQVQTSSGIHELTVQSPQPATTELTIQSGVWPADAPEFAQFAVSSQSVGLTKPFRILSIQEDAENPELMTLTALEQNVNKYADADNMVSSGTVNYEKEFARFPDAPVITNVQSGTDQLFKSKDGKIISRIFLEWQHNPSSFVDEFLVYYRRQKQDQHFQSFRTRGKDAFIDNVQDGVKYEIYVLAENPLGRRSKNPIKVVHTVVGKTEKPSDVTGLIATQSGPDVRLDFDPIEDLDLSHYAVRLGHPGDTWDDAKYIGQSSTNSFLDRNIQHSPAKYFVRAVDTSWNFSENAATFEFSVPAPGTPTATISFNKSEFVLNITPDPSDEVPVSEYVVRQNGNEVFRGKTSTFSGPADWLGAKTFDITVVNVAGRESSVRSVVGTIIAPLAPELTAFIAETSYYLQWSAQVGTLPISHYVVKDTTANKVLAPRFPGTIFQGNVNWEGNRNFEVYAVDSAGNIGASATTYVNVIAPTINGLQSAVSRSILKLSWTGNRESLPIRNYHVYEGPNFNTATLLGTVNAETFSLPVDWNGSKTFYVVAEDTAGNIGPEASVIETIDPPSQPDVTAEIVDQNVHLSWSDAGTELLIQKLRLESRLEWHVDTFETTIGEARDDISAVTENIDHLVISTIATPVLTTSGNTTGFRITVPAEMTKQWYGKTITVRVKAASSGANPGTTLTTTYSTNNVGNAGENTFTLDGTPTWYEFEYTVAQPGSAGVIDHYISIWGEAGKDAGIWEVELLTQREQFQTATGSATTFPAKFLGVKRFYVTPIDEAGNEGPAGEATLLVEPPGAFNFTTGIRDVFADFEWDTPEATLPIGYYEMRRGATFNTAAVVAKVSSNNYSFPADWLGTETFWITAYDTAGNASPVQTGEIDIVAPSAPAPRSEVIDNNVLLRWSNGSGTLPVVETEIRKGSDYATAEVMQTMDATFATFFEFKSGEYTYWLANVDSAGNHGTPAAITTVVSEPPDFVLQTAYTSDFAGTKINVIDGPNGLLFGIDETKTYDDHFQDNGFNSAQDQINAGYPIFVQPVDHLSPASYQEEYDVGGVLKSSIITITPTLQRLAGDGNIEVDIEFREKLTDPWQVFPNQNRVYAQNFQYVRFTLRLAADSKHDLVEVSRIDMRLNVKIRNDAGSGYAYASDTNGTQVYFNVDFVDVASITVTPNVTTPVIPVYDFEDTQNPTGFTVYLFDKNGNRVNGDFSWAVRGY